MKTITFFYLACFVALFANTDYRSNLLLRRALMLSKETIMKFLLPILVSKDDYCKMATKVANNSFDFMMLETKESCL